MKVVVAAVLQFCDHGGGECVKIQSNITLFQAIIPMGARNSRSPSPSGQADGNPASSTHPPPPHIEAPYAGPWAEYQFIDVTVPVDGDVTFSFCDTPMTSTRSSCALSSLEGLYAQGYSLVTFCRVPSSIQSQQKKPFAPGKDLKYQGIFCSNQYKLFDKPVVDDAFPYKRNPRSFMRDVQARLN
ncbi:hypothetical protein BaRGS_00012343 [Batillaria attramentaria]|uniref:Uncharacterized protein n=1 Tax=Batillaria attramentaria TaxID=370345 RepID=A0ABD0LA25_9CAEN